MYIATYHGIPSIEHESAERDPQAALEQQLPAAQPIRKKSATSPGSAKPGMPLAMNASAQKT